MSQIRGWQLFVDWSGGGGLTGPLEDVTNLVNRTTVVAYWGRPVDDISLDAPSSEASFELINRTRDWDRWLSPENSASPIYGKIYPGKQVSFNKTVRGDSLIYAETWATNTAGWTPWATGSVARVASPSETGDGALQFTSAGGTATVGAVGPSVSIVTEPRGSFTVTMRVFPSITLNTACQVQLLDKAGAVLFTSSPAIQSAPASTWTTITGTGLGAGISGAVAVRPRLYISGTPAAGVTVAVDSVTMQSVPADSGKTYTLYSGLLDQINVDSLGTARTFSGKALDAWGRPNATQLSTTVYQGIRTGAAIGIVLDRIGWTGPRALDPGATVIPYWWEEGTSATEAITKLVNSEGTPAIAYVEAGTFVFRDRHHRIRSVASLASQATVTHVIPAGTGPGGDFKIEAGTFQYNHGLNNIVNSARFAVDQRRAETVQEVWASEDPISMVAGTFATIFAQTDNPVTGALTPTEEDGDIERVLDTQHFTATLDRTDGQKFIITVFCNNTGTLSRIRIRGNPITVARTVQAVATDPASISRYQQENSWPDQSNPVWANIYDATALATRIIAIYADNQPRITFTVVAFNDRYTSMMLGLRISDRITVRHDVLGINSDFHVERLEHAVDRLQVHRLTISAVKAEPLAPGSVLTFDGAGLGFDQGAFGVAGIDSYANIFIFDAAGNGFDQGVFST